MDLETTLKLLRQYGVASAEVPGPGGVLRVVFEPSINGPLPGEAPTPGGWKGPDQLDRPFDEVP